PDPLLREVNSFKDEVLSRIPGYSSQIEPRVGLDGKEQPARGVVVNVQRDDVVSREMVRLGLEIALPPDHILGPKPSLLKPPISTTGFPLNDEQVYRFR